MCSRCAMPRCIQAVRSSIANETHRTVGSLSMQEAMEIERETHAFHTERHRLAEEKKHKYGLPRKDEILTQKEREARIWAFMYVTSSIILHLFRTLNFIEYL